MELLMSIILFGAIESPDKVVSAQNQVSDKEILGQRPYEMVWADRVEDHVPLIDFEDLTGWNIALYNDADAIFQRSREQQMWGQYTGKLEYSGKSQESKLIISPPSPINVPDTFDCIDLWCYGNNWGWVPDPSTPQVNLAIRINDSEGQSYRIPLTNVRWKEWWLIHKRIEQETLTNIKFPCQFVGIEVSGISNTERRTIYLDSLAFYTEELKPIEFEPRPARNLKPFPGQTQGLNGTGEGTLPFPVREETILPTNYEADFENKVLEVENGAFEFWYIGRDANICYTYRPQNGNLGEFTVEIDAQTVVKPLDDGGVRFVQETESGKLESSKLEDNKLIVTFLYPSKDGAYRVQYQIQIWQKSLILDVFCLGGIATELSLGKIADVQNPQLIQIPYLTFGGSNPRILMMGSSEKPSFASVWVDWYRSNGSELYSKESVEGSNAYINGGVRYNAKTDGKRNDMFERLFITISPTFEETLPTIANPPSPWGKEAGNYLWQETWGPQDYEKERQRSKMLRSYGIEHLIQCNHEITWRDEGESFTLRTRSAPGKGGDEALQKYVSAQKSLGWRSGLYTNYCDFSPVNEHWTPDGVQRTPQNEWRAAWPRCYALKPSKAVEWDAKLAPIIKQKFDSNSAYTDVHTAVSPWGYCDYDARVPGAGTFTATFYAYGEILLNDQKVYDGPIFSEGTYQWLYAGLASGNYGLAYTGLDLYEYPLNVAFDLLKIHPLECDIGMPWTSQFMQHQKDWSAPDHIDFSIDRFISATLAYGHIGWLVEEAYGIRRTCRSYYLIQQVAKRYAMQNPIKIEYADIDGNWMNTSQALATGNIKDSRLHVIYENGLEIFINWQKEKNWEVKSDELPKKELILPPNGFFAFDKNGFISASAIYDGHKVDQVISDEYVYLDGRDISTSNEWLSSSGAVAMKFIHDDSKLIALQITDIDGNERIGFRCEINQPKCLAYDADGNELGNVTLGYDSGKVWLSCIKDARYYYIR
jgi:hypothetical protein